MLGVITELVRGFLGLILLSSVCTEHLRFNLPLRDDRIVCAPAQSHVQAECLSRHVILENHKLQSI